MSSIDFAKEQFAAVIRYPPEASFRVLDLSGPESESAIGSLVRHEFTLGRYDEKRGIYTQPHFLAGVAPEDVRCVHLGIDMGGPIGTPVYAAASGSVCQLGYNPEAGDYGYCLITQHVLQGVKIFMLYGHLGSSCMRLHKVGSPVEAGQLLGHLGAPEENGGWPSHLHFQLSYREPTTHDLPGVASLKEREQCLKDFPDPRLVVGMLYKD